MKRHEALIYNNWKNHTVFFRVHIKRTVRENKRLIEGWNNTKLSISKEGSK